MTHLFILDGHNPVPMEDDHGSLLEWGRWMETADRSVELTQITPEIQVSTVFLGLDHSFHFQEGTLPMLFETTIFGGPHDQDRLRYSTWDEAQAGHAQIVAGLQKELSQ